MLQDKRITLIVSGGIAAYKSCETARALMRAGAHVRVVMTEHATKFVTPLTFEALTGCAHDRVAAWSQRPYAAH